MVTKHSALAIAIRQKKFRTKTEIKQRTQYKQYTYKQYMKKITSTLLIPIFIFTSCISEKEHNAVSKVGALWGAENYTISHLKLASTEKGTHNTITVTFKNLKSVDEHYSKEKITSLSALKIIENLEEKEYKDFDQIQIIIDNNSSTFEKTYKISKLLATKPFLKEATDFFEKIDKKDTASLRELLDKKLVSDTTLYQLIAYTNELDSMYGKLNNITFTGFSFNKTPHNFDPILVISSEATNGKTITFYTIEINEETKKIIGISLNNE